MAKTGSGRKKVTVETEKGLQRNVANGGLSRKPVSLPSRTSMKWPAQLSLVHRCTIWFPTYLGAFLIASLLLTPVAWWLARGESFLSVTQPLPAEVLVVEDWIGRPGIRAAVEAVKRSSYR